MKALELRKRSKDDLISLLGEKLLHAEELALALRQKKQKNVKELRATKKDIARIKTILRQTI